MFPVREQVVVDPLFLPKTLPSWTSPPLLADAAGDLAARAKAYRSAAKVWKRSTKFKPCLENNCPFLLDLLDMFEESRSLSDDELSLCALCRTTLETLILERAAHWKQRGKFRAIVEGDANTRFFHARASQCLRRNSIRSLDVDGCSIASHDAKAAALLHFYRALLGVIVQYDTRDGPLDYTASSGALYGSHWHGLLKLLPLYRSISWVRIGDGRRAAFWLEAWLPCGPLDNAMHELFTHCTQPTATVRHVVNSGVMPNLVPRLSSTASVQLNALHRVLEANPLSAGADSRYIPLCAMADGRLRTAALYGLYTFTGVRAHFFDFVWGKHAPSKAKIFVWLLVQNRIQSRANLLHKKIIKPDESSCALCGASSETAAHIVFDCAFARRFWAVIGAHSDASMAVDEAGTCALPPSAPPASASTLRVLCLWHLWKHRNGVVFNKLAPSIQLILKCCRDDAVLWRARLPVVQRSDVDSWLLFLHHPR
ncbi:unnamed protein product [Alopecurus aequalis]